MTELRFEWNHAKSNSNAKKHGIDFEEAKSVFYDDDALLIKDSVHSVQEDRFLLLGMSVRLRIILVCHCVRGMGDTIRIISARKANRHE